MTGASAEEAVDALLRRLRGIAACLTARPLMATGRRALNVPVTVSFVPHSEPVRLRTTGVRRTVSMTMRLECLPILVVGGRPESIEASVVAYSYRLLDRDANEIIAYHWHPAGVSRVTRPHLHLSNKVVPIATGRGQEPLALADLHIASGFIEFADVARMLIEELSIQPRRDDWRDILDARAANSRRRGT